MGGRLLRLRTVDLETGTLAGGAERLTSRELDPLRALAERPGETVPRERLLEALEALGGG